jgi:hypothetical protein
MQSSPSQEEFGRTLRKTASKWSLAGPMILLACREAAKHTSCLPSELEPRNAATEEELRNAREKMRPNLMPKNGPRPARISEWEKSGANSSFISSS